MKIAMEYRDTYDVLSVKKRFKLENNLFPTLSELSCFCSYMTEAIHFQAGLALMEVAVGVMYY